MDYRLNEDIEGETTSIGINVMNYSTRLADYEISDCAKCKHICFYFKKNFTSCIIRK